jgi:hypothetical protein
MSASADDVEPDSSGAEEVKTLLKTIKNDAQFSSIHFHNNCGTSKIDVYRMLKRNSSVL